ncbi:prepilin-type N-terminal cleavage/methylation domain-containing protein [Persephonella sp. KM09-Lau-8]|uniref:prepilin-type N-terminal cleavage/methylation domain-containing protein n=1 Tax=Persephonella sp. KM09-Lau-8 TaxID=1158345 RepID=UPI00049676AE|nr:prepilin-type N-terminal cleavage/methylation domain-containing protein [Persephonella sp. KM09-Lau-8]
MVRKIRGFTIVELIIVIVIFLILLAVVYKPIVQKIQAHKVEGEIKKVYGLLQEGRIQAFSKKKELRFTLSSSGNSSTACLYDVSSSSNLKCVNLSVPFAIKSGASYITITDRGVFNPSSGLGETIYYTGNIKTPAVNCLKISLTRVRMGVWDGTSCNIK